jgi:hypothetical protein
MDLTWRKCRGGCIRLHNEELRNLYTSPSFITVIEARRMGLVGHVAVMCELRNAYKILVGKSEAIDITWKTWA